MYRNKHRFNFIRWWYTVRGNECVRYRRIKKIIVVYRTTMENAGVMIMKRWRWVDGHSKLYSTAIRHASDIWGVRPCCRRLCLDEKGVSHAVHECPNNLDTLWGSRERDLFGVCETSSSVWFWFSFRFRDDERGSGETLIAFIELSLQFCIRFMRMSYVSSVRTTGSLSWEGVTKEEQYDEQSSSSSESDVEGYEDPEEKPYELESISDDMRRGGGEASTSWMIWIASRT